MKTIYDLFTRTLNPKLFVQIIFSATTLLFMFNLIIWTFFTKQILSPMASYRVGDLGRLSLQTSSIHFRKENNTTLYKQHINSKDWNGEKIDVLTIGDSYSMGAAGGINPYYQDYISNLFNVKVLNITSIKKTNYIETILALIDNGLLLQMQPKVIIIESVERSVIERFSTDINWNFIADQKEFYQHFKNTKNKRYKQTNISIINTGNYDFILNSLHYYLSSKPVQSSKVYKAKLTTHLFSVKASDSLLFYNEDLKNISNSTYNNVITVNQNFNRLAHLLSKQNITLVFMPIVDKYNLYSNYIYNNPFPSSSFFELLRPLQKNYYFVDTKSVLSAFLPEKVDLFYADDTHWNYLAAEAIIHSIPFEDFLKK